MPMQGYDGKGEVLLELRDLSMAYLNKPVLNKVSFQVRRGGITGLLGPNASGKTTLIKIINSLITNYSGQVLINGHAPGIESKKITAYLPDKTIFPDWMRIRDCIAYLKDFYADFDEVKAREIAKVLKLEESDKLKKLSKGTVEKVQLMLVMSRAAQLYVFDEPLGAVDPASRDFIINTILSNYNENAAVFLSTHLIADVEHIIDHVLFLQEGEVVLDDEADAVRERTGMSLDAHFREVFRC